MEGIEFFTSPEGQVYYRKDGQDAKRLTGGSGTGS